MTAPMTREELLAKLGEIADFAEGNATVSSTEREPGPMVPWELNCQRAVCAAPECECPALSSNHPREVGK